MKLNAILVFISLIVLASCTAQDSASTSDTVSLMGEATNSHSIEYVSAKTIEKENMYIDVDFDFVGEVLDRHTLENYDKLLTDPQIVYKSIMKEYPQELEMLRAAWHRFFSNGKIVDHVWECSAKTASELNMSERAFNFMANSMDDLRKSVKEGQSKGIIVEDMAITQGYLDGLLSEIPSK